MLNVEALALLTADRLKGIFMPKTVSLIAESRDGQPQSETVSVEIVGENQFELLSSPAVTPGLAAGDIFELVDGEPHGYRIIKRGGNISLQIFFPHSSKECFEFLSTRVEHLQGRVDGGMNGSHSSMLVLTIPVTVGFSRIEELMSEVKMLSPNCEWYYGNVYDLTDGITPLNWWLEG